MGEKYQLEIYYYYMSFKNGFLHSVTIYYLSPQSNYPPHFFQEVLLFVCGDAATAGLELIEIHLLESKV